MSDEQQYPRGNELLRQVVNKILTCPAEFNQQMWHCGTTHCTGGWAQILGGLPQSESTVKIDAQTLLELSNKDADWLFSANRSVYQIYQFAKARLAGQEIFKDGYNRDGYDRDGYNRDGYNRDGYNRAGYDRDGYDRTGYDRAGYNRDGYNRAGYDWAGYDRAGYDRDDIQLPLL